MNPTNNKPLESELVSASFDRAYKTVMSMGKRIEQRQDAAEAAIAALASDMGELTELTTDDKTDLVSAINEVDSHADVNSEAIAALDSAKQPKTLDTPIEVGGVEQETVEGTLQAINSHVGSLDAENVKTTGDQTVAGVKTFSDAPAVPSLATSIPVESNDGVGYDENGKLIPIKTIAAIQLPPSADYIASNSDGFAVKKTADTTVTEDSTALVTSGAVFTAVKNAAILQKSYDYIVYDQASFDALCALPYGEAPLEVAILPGHYVYEVSTDDDLMYSGFNEGSQDQSRVHGIGRPVIEYIASEDVHPLSIMMSCRLVEGIDFIINPNGHTLSFSYSSFDAQVTRDCKFDLGTVDTGFKFDNSSSVVEGCDITTGYSLSSSGLGSSIFISNKVYINLDFDENASELNVSGCVCRQASISPNTSYNGNDIRDNAVYLSIFTSRDSDYTINFQDFSCFSGPEYFPGDPDFSGIISNNVLHVFINITVASGVNATAQGNLSLCKECTKAHNNRMIVDILLAAGGGGNVDTSGLNVLLDRRDNGKGSYASSDKNPLYLIADTPEGGFNSLLANIQS